MSKTAPKGRSALLEGLRRYHFAIIIFLAIVFFAFEGMFLYRYFYLGLTQSKVLFELKQQTALEELKVDVYEKLAEFHKAKQKERPIDWDALRDPFAPAVSAIPSQ